MGIKIDTLSSPQPGREKEPSFLEKDIQFNFSRFTDKKKYQFYSELALLLRSGVDVRFALEIMSEEEQNEQLDGLLNRLIKGQTFSAALNGISSVTDYEVQTMRIGEETGRLQVVMEEVADYFKGKVDLKNQLMGLLTYPLLVLSLALAVTYFMLVQVVPMFEQIFRSFDAELPKITQIILGASAFMQENGFLVLAIMTAISVFFIFSKRKPWFRSVWAKLILGLPLIGSLSRKIYLARFTRSMQLLVSSDIPITTALEMVAGMIDFQPMESALLSVNSEIVRGCSFHESLSAHPQLFDKRFCSLIRVSEELNQLESMFKKLAEQYKDEVKNQSEIIGKVAEPALIIMIAAFVGFILVAMYLPIFEMSEAIL